MEECYITEKPSFENGVELTEAAINLRDMVTSLMTGCDIAQRATDLMLGAEEFVELVKSICVELKEV